MLRVREIVEELKVFERNKVPFEDYDLYSDVFSWGGLPRVLFYGLHRSLKPLFGKREV